MSAAAIHDPAVLVLFVGGALALAGVAAYAASAVERKRSAALADIALRMGFTYEAKVPEDRAAALGPFHLFKRGHSRIGRNLMTRKAGDGEVSVLDYQYTTGGGKSSHTHRQTVAIFPGVGAALPEFTLGPEHWWDRIGQVFGYQDIDFEASPEFSSNYLLRGPDESAIRAAFGADALGFLAANQGWSVESCGGSLAVYRADKRCKPEELQPFLAETANVRRAVAHA
jgi:hypothetical protein